ncbi:MAG: hypothetical protein ACYDAO_09940 [Thermoplasmataceae archaeon]
MLSDPLPESRGVQAIEGGGEAVIIIIIASALFGIIFYPNLIASIFSGLGNSFLRIPIDIVSGIINLFISIINFVIGKVTGGVTSAGSYVYSHTIGAL